MSDLSALADLSPEQLEAVKALGANQGTRDPKQLPGRPLVWRVGNEWKLVYYLPGTSTVMFWDATQEELAEKFGGVDAAAPSPDRTLTMAEFTALAPVRGGRINELRNTSDDPWTQFFADYNESAELRPWLKDPDMIATITVAYLEGRQPTPDELSKTDWWNEHTEEERAWLERSATAGRDELSRDKNDMVRKVTDDMLKLGLTRVSPKIIEIMASKRLTGQWSEAYYFEQVNKLADPFSVGTLNPAIKSLITEEMTQTRREEDTVREMAVRWLGPTMGNMGEAELKKWAGWMRNDPDAKINFEEHLRKQRLALFPKYENENLSYEDIVGPFRNLATNIWGQPINDEAMLVDLANLGDYTEAQKRLRKTGLDRGVQKVVYDALADIAATPAGERVVQSAI